jgi:hypothetical protein
MTNEVLARTAQEGLVQARRRADREGQPMHCYCDGTRIYVRSFAEGKPDGAWEYALVDFVDGASRTLYAGLFPGQEMT